VRTETHRQSLERVQAAIARGHRLGVCDSEGNSVARDDGSCVAKPRGGYVTFRKVYPRYPKE